MRSPLAGSRAPVRVRSPQSALIPARRPSCPRTHLPCGARPSPMRRYSAHSLPPAVGKALRVSAASTGRACPRWSAWRSWRANTRRNSGTDSSPRGQPESVVPGAGFMGDWHGPMGTRSASTAAIGTRERRGTSSAGLASWDGVSGVSAREFAPGLGQRPDGPLQALRPTAVTGPDRARSRLRRPRTPQRASLSAPPPAGLPGDRWPCPGRRAAWGAPSRRGRRPRW